MVPLVRIAFYIRGMSNEETVLTNVFPEYRSYKATTEHIILGFADALYMNLSYHGDKFGPSSQRDVQLPNTMMI
jgi:hypothetical protein